MTRSAAPARATTPGAPPGTIRARPGRGFGRWTWLVPALDALIEGAWIAVADAAFAAVAGSAALGPIPFAIVAAASLVWSRHAGDRTTAMAGLAVLYISAFVGAGLLGGTFAHAIGVDGRPIVLAQAAAALGALAVFRGSRHSDTLEDDLVVGSLLQWGFPLLAVPWLFASTLAGPQREAFAAAAFPATLVFAAAGLLALGLARLDSLSALSGVDWRTNRAWLVLLGGVLAVMVVIAVPTAFVLGTPITLLAAGLLGPLAVVLTPFAAVFQGVIEFVFFLLTPLIDFLTSLARQRGADQQPGPLGGSGPLAPPIADQGDPSTIGLIVLAGIAIVIAVVVFLVVLRLTYRPRSEPETTPEGALEEREFRLPQLTLPRPHLSLPHRRPRPTTASGAYLAFLADLSTQPDLARTADEPPGTHAARLRRAGFSDPRAALLAADYALERYALRDVTPHETARAVRRETHLREVIRQRHRPRPASPPDAGT